MPPEDVRKEIQSLRLQKQEKVDDKISESESAVDEVTGDESPKSIEKVEIEDDQRVKESEFLNN